jgi:cellulose synthase/poly-beta-1,6-N-acetylglucosamine synthase-like glycosyltransferase
LFYHARAKGSNHHFKAGNLQAGIEFTAILSGGPGEFIATLDYDMIPEPHWLRAMIPHLLGDDKMALCTPPQVCENIELINLLHFTNINRHFITVLWKILLLNH